MKSEKRMTLPRLPLDGSLDLTYRCNNNCIHCWLWLPCNAPQGEKELTCDEIFRIVQDARAMGCQAWSISGGEPMLRPDFADIFDFITRKSVTYKINTNGTLITPEIARLLKRKGRKMVALYGATADVHDRVTRNPGSFEATMRGFSYLKEAGVGFTVQIVPMQANYFQYDAMLALAQSLSPHYRVGAPWLWLSSCRSVSRNNQIRSQRLDPAEVVKLDRPNPLATLSDNLQLGEIACETHSEKETQPDDRLFAACIDAQRDFHIDPYGQLSFCCFIKDPDLRYDLRQGTFQQGWDEFIPSLKDKVRGGAEYRENCGSCELRRHCRWCAVYAYLEHGRYSAKVEFLCRVAQQAVKYEHEWQSSHIQYYQIAGMTLLMGAEFELTEESFPPVYRSFRVNQPGKDRVTIHHAASIPSLKDLRLGKRVYRRLSWEMYSQPHHSHTYVGLSGDHGREPQTLAIFNPDHSRGKIFTKIDLSKKIKLDTLFSLPSDQVVLARMLAERQAFFIRSAGCILDGKGVLFVGRFTDQKSAVLKMIRGRGELLAKECVIVRSWPDAIQMYGFPGRCKLDKVSGNSATLSAVFYLQESEKNDLIPVEHPKDRAEAIRSFLVQPLLAEEWWDRTLGLAEKIFSQLPAYRLRLNPKDKSIDILQHVRP
ncbi:radical SAM protein [candidate division KSB1 bacterium]|nr:radical SAM protein [candidate division KSB1 bacterium]